VWLNVGFYDDRSGVFFSSDCFGVLLSAVPRNAADLSDKDLREGQLFWAVLDAPWLHKVDRSAFARELDGIRRMAPKMVLSSDLPAASGDMTERLLASLAAAPARQPFVGPDQAALERMLRQMTEVAWQFPEPAEFPSPAPENPARVKQSPARGRSPVGE
jgi:hypothetical protein